MKNLMKSSSPASDRSGFTLLEMIIAMTLISIVLGLTVPFFRTEVQAFGNVAGRDDAQQNARYGVSMIDRELRVAGVGVVDPQPLIVQAAPYAITFNVDLITRDKNDRGAAYYDPDIDPNAAASMTKSSKITLPLSALQYPFLAATDPDYSQNTGVLSDAETISFWVAPDPDPAAGGHVRSVPSSERDAGNSRGEGAGSTSRTSLCSDISKPIPLGQLVEIPQNTLPIYHSAPIHNSKADTAKSALTDSIRVVRVRISGQFTDRKGVKNVRPVETGVRIMNAGLLHFHTCGDPPIFGAAVVAVGSNNPSTKVTVTWNSAVDQTSGEKDVEQYSIYKRSNANPLFGEPIASVPGGTPTYSFTDTQVTSGDQLVYGIAAVDCGGQSSAVNSAPLVIVP